MRFINISGVVFAAGLATACNTMETEAPASSQGSASASAATAAATQSSGPLTDGRWTTDRFGGITLVIRNGEPVSYTAGTFRASSLAWQGNTLMVNEGAWRVSSADDNVATGRWRLGSTTNTLTLTRQ